MNTARLEKHPQIPRQRPRCGKSCTSGGQNNAFSAFRCQKIALEGCMDRPPNLSGPRVRKNKGAREAETCDERQNFMIREKNNWRENIRVGEGDGKAVLSEIFPKDGNDVECEKTIGAESKVLPQPNSICHDTDFSALQCKSNLFHQKR